MSDAVLQMRMSSHSITNVCVLQITVCYVYKPLSVLLLHSYCSFSCLIFSSFWLFLSRLPPPSLSLSLSLSILATPLTPVCAAQCAMCGHHIKAMHHVNLLKEEIKLLEMKLFSLLEMEKEDCAPSEERIYDSSCFNTNCLIEDVTVQDGEYVYDLDGRICYCRV